MKLKNLTESHTIWTCDIGLGKTFVGSEKAFTFNNQILVVCQKSKIDDWVEHYEKYYDVSISNLTSRHPDYTARVMIINYDIVWRRAEILLLRDFTLMLDESSLIKNSTAKRTKLIMKLRASNVILLSGTPTGGKYEELVTQANLLGWKISKSIYWNTFVEYFNMDIGGYPIPKVTGYKNVPRLKEKLHEHGAVFMKTNEVINLPKQTDIVSYIDPTPEYKKFKNDRLITINNVELLGDTSLTKLLYLRQLAAMYNKNKINALNDLIESTEDRIVIFYNWQYEYDMLEKMIKKPISVISGPKKSLDNYEVHDNSITLVQYQAGAMGVNLQKSNKIIYFSLPLSSELFEQSKKRIHRIGQDRPCWYYYLVTKKSVEVDILETLKMRMDYNSKLFEKGEG